MKLLESIAGKLRETLNSFYNYFDNRLVPIGSIIAYYDNLYDTLRDLPSGFVRCDGQVLDDPDSPFDGKIIPDWNGDSRIMKGGSASGNLSSVKIQNKKNAQVYNFGTVVWIMRIK